MAADIDLQRPAQRQFVVDHANMITADDEQKIVQIADRLLTDAAAPIVVVTIESMAKHRGAGMSMETFAHVLFDQWGIGAETVGGKASNRGILLVVSRDDRRSRIELGGGWGHSKDPAVEAIMNDQIVRRFKLGHFSTGILQGVVALDHLARQDVAARPAAAPHAANPVVPHNVPNSVHYAGQRTIVDILFSLLIWAGVLALIVFSVISIAKHGTNGWAWMFWSAIFGLIGILLYAFLTSGRHRRYHRGFSSFGRSSYGGGSYGGGSFGGGSFGGGSFGGGSSGGGGASGSW